MYKIYTKVRQDPPMQKLYPESHEHTKHIHRERERGGGVKSPEWSTFISRSFDIENRFSVTVCKWWMIYIQCRIYLYTCSCVHCLWSFHPVNIELMYMWCLLTVKCRGDVDQCPKLSASSRSTSNYDQVWWQWTSPFVFNTNMVIYLLYLITFVFTDSDRYLVILTAEHEIFCHLYPGDQDIIYFPINNHQCGRLVISDLF